MNTPCPQRKTKVLLIEDDPLFQDIAEAVLAMHCVLLIAGSLEDADATLALHDDINVLILDGFVPVCARSQKMDTTVALAERIAAERAGRITLFAASGDDKLNAAFVRIGAHPTTKATAYTSVARHICGQCCAGDEK